jgi:hypothetical protein
LAQTKPQHKAKPSKKASLVRSARNHAKHKYERQRVRTEANKARRRRGDTCKQRRIARRRSERLALAIA